MALHEELLAAIAYIRDRTGDPNAWQTGLTSQEVAAVLNPATGSEQLEAILGKVRQRHPTLFGTPTPIERPPAPPPDREQGAAAEAIAHAEAALARQNTASSRLDMQVIAAILNAHLKSVDGREALATLQREIEAAVQTRSDLDTPAGARDFQRFLIGKLRDIRAVVLDANLDDTSKSALMAAWTSLYDASRNEQTAEPQRVSTAAAGDGAVDDPDTEWDPSLDAMPANDPGLSAGSTGGSSGAAMPTAPSPPGIIPGFGAGSMPGLGAAPGSMGGWGLPIPGLQDGARTDPALRDVDDDGVPRPDGPDDHGTPGEQEGDHPQNASAQDRESPAGVPTTVTLPDGETVTAATPQLAAAIKAAVGGMPIADAFRQQGITIPPPGSVVTDPIDPPRLTPGDVGIFTDRHALALGPGKALLDGQIQHIATVSGPSFLGWEHPPATTATGATPAEPDAPTPTRPAAAPTTSQQKPAGPPGGA